MRGDYAGSSGDLLPPSPPGEKASTRLSSVMTTTALLAVITSATIKPNFAMCLGSLIRTLNFGG
jgi:hypothetical protein